MDNLNNKINSNINNNRIIEIIKELQTIINNYNDNIMINNRLY